MHVLLGKSKPFTDENAAWLKMMEDGNEEVADDDEFPEDEAEALDDEFDLDDDVSGAGSSDDDRDVDDDGEVLLNIEKKSRKLDAKKKKDA